MAEDQVCPAVPREAGDAELESSACAALVGEAVLRRRARHAGDSLAWLRERCSVCLGCLRAELGLLPLSAAGSPCVKCRTWVFRSNTRWQQAEQSSGPGQKPGFIHTVTELLLAGQNQKSYIDV